MGRGPEQTFLPRRHTNGQQAYERMLTLLATREVQITKPMRYHLAPVRMTVMDKTSKKLERSWKRGTLAHLTFKIRLFFISHLPLLP